MRTDFKGLSLVTLGALLSWQSLWPEETQPAKPRELEPYRVKASRLDYTVYDMPLAVTVIDQTMIQSASTQLSINEALQTVPGVFALNPDNFAQDSRIAIRGFGARSDFGIRGVRLIVDGIPATLPDGQAGVDGIDLGSAQSIEVLRGPASAIYGPASGGVIRIETEDAPERPFIETRITGGEYGLVKTQFKSGWADGHWNVLVSTSHLDYQGYRDHSRTVNTTLNTKLRYLFESGASLTTVVQWIDFPQQDDPGGLTEAELKADPQQARDRNLQFDSGESVQQQKLGFAYRGPLAEGHEWRVNGFMVQRDFANKLPFTGGGQVEFDRFFYGGSASYAYSGEQIRWVSGIDIGQQNDARENYDNQNGDRGPLALDQDEAVTNLGGFFTAELSLSESFSVSSALRYDEVSFDVSDHLTSDGDDSGEQTFRELSPMLGFRWRAQPELVLYGNLATAYETPSTTEFDNPDGGGFNDSLKVQTALSMELGVKGTRSDWPGRPTLDLAVFTIDVDDALVPYELESSPGREFYRNAGSARKNGMEAAFSLQPSERFSAMLSYTYSDFYYRAFQTPDGNFEGNRLPGVPEHLANLRLHYTLPSGLSLIWNTRWTGALQADDANTTEVSAYSTSDLRMHWERDLGSWTLEAFLGLNNVFDKAYSANIRINAFGGRYYEPAPERNIYGGMRLRYWWEGP